MAREAGVSKTTVSFAFNSPARVKPATAARIHEVAGRLGYEPHPVARLLAQRGSQTIGLLTPQALSVMFANPFFASFSEGVAAVAEENGFALQFISPLRGSLARAVNRSAVDGVVAIGLSGDHPEVEQIRRARLPTVLVDSTAFAGQTLVDIDDEAAAFTAAAAPHRPRPPRLPRRRRRAAAPDDTDGPGRRHGPPARGLPARARRRRRRPRAVADRRLAGLDLRWSGCVRSGVVRRSSDRPRSSR